MKDGSAKQKCIITPGKKTSTEDKINSNYSTNDSEPSELQIKVNTKKKNINTDMVPLHKGSMYRVFKKDLMNIYSSHPAVYALRLADLIFGKEHLAAVSKMTADRNINLLDQSKLESFISKYLLMFFFSNNILHSHFFVEHIIQVFGQQGTRLEPNDVENMLETKLSNLRNVIIKN